MMKLEQNKAIVRDYLNEIVNRGNMAAFDSYFSEDVVFNNFRGFRQQYLARMQAIRSAFPTTISRWRTRLPKAIKW
jgi:ketosteroid isomerase-like protein